MLGGFLSLYLLKLKFMSVYITLTEKEILETPNDSDLGGLVRNRLWKEKEYDSLREYDDEKFIIIADETGLVKGIHIPKKNEYTENGYDKCVVCGKVSPYTTQTHIDMRVGYVEGGGQGCFQPSNCKN